MNELRTALEYLGSTNDGRLAAAGLLFLVIWALKNVPVVGPWLDRDGPWSWLTSERKKAAANVLLAMGPVAVLLSNGAAPGEVVWEAITIILGAAGIQGTQKAVRKRAAVDNDAAPPKDQDDS